LGLKGEQVQHGIDLGYDSKLVAAKSWAALFAVREWAMLAERGELGPKPEKPEPTIFEIAQQFQKNQKNEKLLNEWKARSMIPGVNIPVNGEPNEYEEGTPERKLVEYCTFWKAKNYGGMSKCIMKLRNVRPEDVKDQYSEFTLESFYIKNVLEEAVSLTKITVDFEIIYNGEQRKCSVEMVLLFQDKNGGGSIRGQAGGEWMVREWDAPVSKKTVDTES